MKQTNENRAGILNAISDWLKLLGLIVLVAEGFLTAVILRTGQSDPYVAWGIGLLGLIVIGLFYDRHQQARSSHPGTGKARFDRRPGPIAFLDAVAAHEGRPLSPGAKEIWEGQWYCHWESRNGNGASLPFVDDEILIQNVDVETGLVLGKGISARNADLNYLVHGIITVHENIGIFGYHHVKTERMLGAFILYMTPNFEVSGFWLGDDSLQRWRGGYVSWKRAANWKDFRPRVYGSGWLPPSETNHLRHWPRRHLIGARSAIVNNIDTTPLPLAGWGFRRQRRTELAAYPENQRP